MEEKKMSKRKVWVIRATVIFLVLMGLLTLFSQTIMNYSLTRVSAQYPEYGSIVTSASSSSTIEAINKKDIKAFADREVENIFVYDMQEVKAGDVLMTVKLGENSDVIEELKQQLEELELAEYYKGKLPSNKPDYTMMELEISDAETALSEAKTALSNAQNKGTIIATAEANLNSARSEITRLDAEMVPLAEELYQLEDAMNNPEDGLATQREIMAGRLAEETNLLNDMINWVSPEVTPEVTPEVDRKSVV